MSINEKCPDKCLNEMSDIITCPTREVPWQQPVGPERENTSLLLPDTAHRLSVCLIGQQDDGPLVVSLDVRLYTRVLSNESFD